MHLSEQKSYYFSQYVSSEIEEEKLIENVAKLYEKEEGVIYTPFKIVDEMINSSVLDLNMTVLEPSCGRGNFLVGLLFFAQKQIKGGKEILDWFLKKVRAYDIDHEAIQDCKRILSCFFKKHFDMQIEENTFCNVIKSDFLLSDISNADLAIGNPPYIRSNNLAPDYLKTLKNKFSFCAKGNVDIYYAFLEKCLSCSNNVSLIVPNNFSYNNSAKVLREELLPFLYRVTDFKDKKIFNNADIHTAIIELRKNSCQQDSFLYREDIDAKETVIKKEILFQEKYWIFSDLQNNKEIKNQKIEIYTGIATLKDDLYKVVKIDNHFYSKKYPNFRIEKEVILPYIKITKYQKGIPPEYLIFPYQNRTVISEELFKNKFKDTYKYFSFIKKELNTRDKGKTDKYETWYAYGRKQGFSHQIAGDALLIPKMVNSKNKPYILKKTNIEQMGHDQFLFTSGYVMPCNVHNQKYVDYLLSSQFLIDAKHYGKTWNGKEEPFYAFSLSQLKNLLMKSI